MKTSTDEQKAIPVVIADRSNSDDNLLATALELSNFWAYLESSCEKSQTDKRDFRILLKTDMTLFDYRAPTGTDPQLVEQFIDLLFAQGYETIVVADSTSRSDMWLENRSVMILADLAGYRYETDNGNSYEIADLSDNLIAFDVPDNSVLHASQLSETWLDAQFRISFAKNKTDEEHRYALGVQNLLAILPLRDKQYHYHHRLSIDEVALNLLHNTDVHFAIIDAIISNHGSLGSRTPNPLPTDTIITSPNLLLADWVAALKMGLDPYTSVPHATALRTIGLPTEHKIIGSLAPYEDWKNVPILLANSVRKRNESAMIHHVVQPWLQSVNTDLFPFKNPLDEQINAVITKYLNDVDEHPLAYIVTVALNFMLGAVNDSLEAWHILYDKDKLYRKSLPLGINLDDYSFADYEAIRDYIVPLAIVAKHSAPDSNGLRWRYIDESVLFEFERVLPIPYDDFIDKVDISLAVQMMYDNVGGTYRAVHHDEQGRVIHQAERNIYLPQPNWMALFGGKQIDVVKIERVEYEDHQQQILWRTVASPNHSAEFDDGIVTFARHEGGTSITIVARQKFSLPLILQSLNLDYVPKLRDTITSNSYTMFFTRTIANYEAAYEGRSPLLGQAWNHNHGEDDDHTLTEITQPLSQAFRLIASQFKQSESEVKEGMMDDTGYVHFDAHQATKERQVSDVSGEILSDLTRAFVKDLMLISNQQHRTKQ